MSKNSPTKIRKELFWVVAGTLLTMIGGLVTVKLLSNLLSLEAFGRYALLFAIVTFLVATLYTPLAHVTLRFAIIAQEASALRSYISLQNKLFVGLSGVSLLALIGASFWFGNTALLAMLALTLAMGLQVVQQYLLMAFRKRRENGVAQLIGAVARPSAVYIAIGLAGAGEVNAIFGLAAGFSVISVVQFFYLKQLPLGRGSFVVPSKTMAEYGGTYFLIGLVTITVFAADRLVLSSFGTLEQVAIYAVLMQVALAPVAFSHAVLTRLAMPILFKAGANPKNFSKLLLVWTGICAFVLLISIVFPVQILIILTNREYAEFAYLFPWMVVGLLLERTMQLLEIRGSSSLTTKRYIRPRLVVVILVPVLQLAVFQIFGFDWLVVGLIAGTAFGVAGTIWVNRSL